MKLKKSRVRAKDIKQGVTFYSVTFQGIRRYRAEEKPHNCYFLASYGTANHFSNARYQVILSTVQRGISSPYNRNRCFFKRKHAEAYYSLLRKEDIEKGIIFKKLPSHIAKKNREVSQSIQRMNNYK